MDGGRERGAVADFEQDPRCGPDPDAGHRDEDQGERVGVKHLLDLNSTWSGYFSSSRKLSANFGRMVSAAALPDTTTVWASRVVKTCSTRRTPMREARGLTISANFDRPVLQSPAGLAQSGRAAVPRPRLEDGWMPHFRAQDLFQGWMELGERGHGSGC
jgi:hypothetical protein